MGASAAGAPLATPCVFETRRRNPRSTPATRSSGTTTFALPCRCAATAASDCDSMSSFSSKSSLLSHHTTATQPTGWEVFVGWCWLQRRSIFLFVSFLCLSLFTCSTLAHNSTHNMVPCSTASLRGLIHPILHPAAAQIHSNIKLSREVEPPP